MKRGVKTMLQTRQRTGGDVSIGPRGAAWLVLGSLTAGVAVGGPRVALVIGGGAYEHARALRNPVQDEKSIAHALRDLGYSVQLLLDAASRRWKPRW
jgi:hypothetical protein